MTLSTTIRRSMIAGAMLVAPLFSANAADYVIDTKGAHASVEFRIKHLGYSWLTGRFNTFEGEFSYDKANEEAAQISVEIQTASLDSNHAERDKHLRGSDFLNVSKFPTAKFVSKSVTKTADGGLDITGDLTLHGVTKSIVLNAEKVGEGDDPWGGYRAGFTATTVISLADFDITVMGASSHAEMALNVEGIRK